MALAVLPITTIYCSGAARRWGATVRRAGEALTVLGEVDWFIKRAALLSYLA